MEGAKGLFKNGASTFRLAISHYSIGSLLAFSKKDVSKLVCNRKSLMLKTNIFLGVYQNVRPSDVDKSYRALSKILLGFCLNNLYSVRLPVERIIQLLLDITFNRPYGMRHETLFRKVIDFPSPQVGLLTF